MKRQVALVVALLTALLGACTRRNPTYCQTETDCPDPLLPVCGDRHECVAMGTPDAGVACDPGNPGATCNGSTPYCDPDDLVCVECLTENECIASDFPICTDGHCLHCANDPECMAISTEFPFCTASGECAECKASTDCTADPAFPTCDDGECRACEADADCAHVEGVCDEPSGECVAAADILYVDGTVGASGPSCAKAAPCKTIAEAVAKVDGAHRYIKIAAGTYPESVTIAAKTVEILGAGSDCATACTEIVPTALIDMPGFLLTGKSVVSFERLVVRDASGTSSGDGIRCQGPPADNSEVTLRDVVVQDNLGAGVESASCRLTIDVSRITGNTLTGVSVSDSQLTLRRTHVASNEGGGVDLLDSDVVIENSFVVRNGKLVGGGTGSALGGIRIRGTLPGGVGASRIELSTIAGNIAAAAVVSTGVLCSGLQVPASSNLVADNVGALQVSDCAWSYSLVGQVTPPPGTDNMNGAPMFVGAAGGDYHIATGSACTDAADDETNVTVDFDGQPRELGFADCGADEL